MPKIRKCAESGGLVFDPTEEELEVIHLRKKVIALEDRVEALEKIMKKSTKGGAK